MSHRRRALRVGVIVVLTTVLGGCDWLGFLGGPSHHSASADGGIEMSDIAHLSAQWRWKLPAITGRPGSIFATPATWRGRVFLAANSGVLYALDESTGNELWHRDFGIQPALTCLESQGLVGSPAVRDDGHGNPLVYINAPDGYLYEINGLTGATVWRSVVQIPSTVVNDEFPWSSPTLFDGRVYVGISSSCDSPFTRGAVKSYDAITGTPIATGWTIPAGYVGAGVWTSVAADASGVYITTGSTTDATQAAHPPTPTNDFDQYSIVKLDPVTLARTGKWIAPPTSVIDPDFASSPILFEATLGGHVTPMVGGCNKDGYFYALRSDRMQLVWKRAVGEGTPLGQSNCLAGGVWDGTRLFVAAHATTIKKVHYSGSVRQLDPATGAIIWQLGLPANPLGSGTVNPNGILAYAGTDWFGGPGNGVFVIDAATGSMVRVLHDIGNFPEYAQPIWVDGRLLTANFDGLVAWAP